MPDQARNAEAVTAMAELAGEVLAVHEVTLIRSGPIRVNIRARELNKLNGFLEFFFKGEGREVKFLPERQPPKPTVVNKHPPPDKKPDDDNIDDEDDTLFDSDDDTIKETQEGDGRGSQSSQGEKKDVIIRGGRGVGDIN
jgi:hypothetical protein